MKRSCETQLLSTINDIAENLDAGRQIDVMLFDFLKHLIGLPTRDYVINCAILQ